MKIFPSLANDKECTGCMACVDSCNKGAIKRITDADGHVYVKVNSDACVGCLKCEKVCYNALHDYGNNVLSLSKPFAAWSRNVEFRKRGTSGGIFASLAKTIIDKGGIVIGADFDGLRCTHRVVSTIEEISTLQGSKYLQSNTEGIYKTIEKYIGTRMVLFSGVGCQVGAVLSYFNKHPKKGNLITVDLVCGGVPSSLLLESYLAHNKQVERISAYRDKSRYVLKGIVKGKNIELSNRPLPLFGFFSGFTNRYSCSDCKFAYAHRKSDITIGDLWGDKEFPTEHEKGISLVICHNEKGAELVSASDITTNDITWQQVLLYNKRIVYGKKHITKQRINLAANYKNYSYKKFNKIYSLNINPIDISNFSFKLTNYLRDKIENKKIQMFIKRLLEQYP